MRIRTPGFEHLEAIHQLIVTYDHATSGYSDFSLEDLRELTGEPSFDPERDWWLVEEDGALIGCALDWGREKWIRWAFFITHPDHRGRGVGEALLARLEERGRELSGKGTDIALRVFVDVKDTEQMKLAAAHGFEEIRRHYTMDVDLSTHDQRAGLPEGVSVRTCTADDLPVAHRLLMDSFAEHWGFTHQPYEEWRQGQLRRRDTDLDLWFLAIEGDKPIGILVGRAMDEMGWVSDLGVLLSARKRGVGAALLRHSFEVFRESGLRRAGLGVDASNATGAVELYERVGMTPVRVYVTFEKRYP